VASQDIHWQESLARLADVFKVPELKNRIFFVAGMFALFVIGLHIPAPFVNPDKISSLFNSGSIWSFIDMMSGGAFKRLSILALGIVPYINSSILMQLLGIAVPQIQKMQKEGEDGRKKISSYTRIGTVILAFLQAGGLSWYMYKSGVLETQALGVYTIIPLMVVMVAGTSFLMWVGEQLTDKGIGNGISLIIFAGIMIRLVPTIYQVFQSAIDNSSDNVLFAILKVGLLLAVFLGIIVFITFVHQAVRQIPIQHARKVVGVRSVGGGNSYLPLKVVTAGVIPIIFAISVVTLPASIAQMMLQNSGNTNPSLFIQFMLNLSPGQSWYGCLIYFLLVVFFTYFYTAVVYNVADIADNLKKNGSFILGIRPGRETEKYIDKVLTRITFVGAMFLGLVAILPYVIPFISQIGSGGVTDSSASMLAPLMGGTSLLIVVGVALDTMKQMEAHLVMRHYEGFIK
jgi:preprotein translocase subunit SecY